MLGRITHNTNKTLLVLRFLVYCSLNCITRIKIITNDHTVQYYDSDYTDVLNLTMQYIYTS